MQENLNFKHNNKIMEGYYLKKPREHHQNCPKVFDYISKLKVQNGKVSSSPIAHNMIQYESPWLYYIESQEQIPSKNACEN